MTSVSENIAPYRDHNLRYQEVWDWDVIVYPDGSLRVLCMTDGCLHEDRYNPHMGAECDCASRSRISSPIVDEYTRPLKEDSYGPGRTGAGRPLLGVTAGSAIPVMSGKAYRLNGPRMSHEGFKGGSIWKIYKDPEPELEPQGFFQRVWEWMNE